MAKQPEVKRLNIHVDPGLHTAFKIAAAAQGKNMTDILLEFIKDYVRKHLPGGFRKGR